MRNGYEIIQVDQNDPRQMEDLNNFAKTFDHEVGKSDWNLHRAYRNGKALGWYYVATCSMLYPSFSPICTPREVLEITRHVRITHKHGNAGAAVLIPKDSPTFTPEIMPHFGFKATNLLLYVSG